MKRFFKGISKKMLSHVEDISSQFGHSGEQGASNERILVSFLKDYLPKRYSVDRGKILAHTDEDSKQIDVIVYDGINNPPLFSEEGFLIAAIETVYGVIEVKTTLNKDELEDANEKSKSVLNKPMLDTMLTKREPGMVSQSAGQTAPPFTACLSFQAGTSIKAIERNLVDDNLGSHLSLVGILNSGVIVKQWKKQVKEKALPSSESQQIKELEFKIEKFEEMRAMTNNKAVDQMIDMLNNQKQKLLTEVEFISHWQTIENPENALLLFLVYLLKGLELVPDRRYSLSSYL